MDMESTKDKVNESIGNIRIRVVIVWFVKSQTTGNSSYYVMVVIMPIIHIVWYVSISKRMIN